MINSQYIINKHIITKESVDHHFKHGVSLYCYTRDSDIFVHFDTNFGSNGNAGLSKLLFLFGIIFTDCKDYIKASWNTGSILIKHENDFTDAVNNNDVLSWLILNPDYANSYAYEEAVIDDRNRSTYVHDNGMCDFIGPFAICDGGEFPLFVCCNVVDGMRFFIVYDDKVVGFKSVPMLFPNHQNSRTVLYNCKCTILRCEYEKILDILRV